MTEIDHPDVLEGALERSMHEPVVLYKHSTLCGLSFRAQREMRQLNEPGDPPVYEVVIQRERSLSRRIESDLGVRHQSPQMIVVVRGRPVFHASHSRVTADAVRRAIAELSPVL